jgi:uncharacterized protein (TIGR00290 family)
VAWSGGKDCCLALHRVASRGAVPALLLTLLTEDGKRSRSHGLRKEIVEAQARSLGAALRCAATSWQDYREAFGGLLRQAVKDGIRDVVFGDIDGTCHRRWEVSTAKAAGMRPHLPLWKHDRLSLLRETFELGIRARIVVVRASFLSKRFLGREMAPAIVRQLLEARVDACGENGEFHTVVVDAPRFGFPLRLSRGKRVCRSGCWIQDMKLEQSARGAN